MNSMEKDQVVHDATKAIGNNGALFTMMELHDVLRIIEQMLAPFKCYIIILKHLRLVCHPWYSRQQSNGTSSSYGTSSSRYSNHSCRCTSRQCKGAYNKFIMLEKFDDFFTKKSMKT
jgi:hypothetical protein